MVSFSWLHLTDLHLGMEEHVALLPAIKDKFFEDVESLHKKSGPWDFVTFTGDLTNRGSKAEFQVVDEFLKELWDYMAKLGSKPVLLAVPGNHDLVRPEPDPRKLAPPEVLVLNQHWTSEPKIQTTFWNEPNSRYRNIVSTAFANYSEWWEKQPHKPQTQSGLLPGDFSAVIEKPGASLGIVGLNSAFLQLGDGDYKGKLAIDARQFQAVCGGNGPQWVKNHNACLLLTHQPPDWLTSDAQQQLVAEIAGNNYFVAHLFGHMHEARFTAANQGGAATIRTCQGSSLFGLEYLAADKKMERVHGYCVGRIEMKGNRGHFTQWPRRAAQPGGQWNFAGDSVDFKLTDDRTKSEEFDLLRPLTEGEANAPQQAVAATVPRPFPQQWAVMVGVNEYEGAINLRYCENDVIELSRAFRESLGFQHVFEFLKDTTLKPERETIYKKLVEIREHVNKQDLFVFYFSGHGLIDDGNDYLLPLGCPPSEAKAFGIRVRDLADLLGKLNCQNTAMFIDACRNVFPAKGVEAGPASSAEGNTAGTVSLGEESKAVLSDKGIVGFFSCDAKDRSFEIEQLKHGSFTYSLLRAIQDGTAETVSELDSYLGTNVPQTNDKYGRPPQKPFAVYTPPERAKLEIFFNTNWRMQAAARFDPLVEALVERVIKNEPLIEQLEFLGQVRLKKQLSDLENQKVEFIESLCRPQGLELEMFQMLWKRLKGPSSSPQMKKK